MQRFFAYRMIMGAAKGLPVYGNNPLHRFADPFHPLDKARLKLLGVQTSKHPSKGVMGGDPIG